MNCSRCDAIRIACVAGEIFMSFVCVESFALQRHANFKYELRILSLFLPGTCLGVRNVLIILFAIDDPLVDFCPSRRWRLE